jgi:hypothetical protein
MKLQRFIGFRTSPNTVRYKPTPVRQAGTSWVCPYCGHSKPSPNGTGSDVACCGEVGHSLPE